jgi:Gas vesicle protein G.
MFILDDLLIGLPAKGLMGIFKKIAEMAEDEVTDVSKIKEELLLNQTLYETDEITEEEFEKREDELLERLSQASEAE